MNSAYLYKWVQISTGKWYVGSRTAKRAHPDDGYICSSATVRPMILETPENWHRIILRTGTPQYIRILEGRFLSFVDAKNDPMSYNKHNGDGKFSTTGSTASPSTRRKMQTSHKGKHVGVKNNFYGKKHTPESIAKSTKSGPDNGMFGKFGEHNPNFGKKRSDESKKKYRDSKLGKKHPAHNPKNYKTCEWCTKIIRLPTNYIRWHGDNCKERKSNV